MAKFGKNKANRSDDAGMSVREAGKRGGRRVSELVDKGKQQES